MTIEAAACIIRRKPQSIAEKVAVADALAVLGRAGMSDEEATIEARRELTLAEIILLGQARVG